MEPWKIGVGAVVSVAIVGGLYYLFRPPTQAEQDDLARRRLDTSPAALSRLTAVAPLYLNVSIAQPAS